MVRITLLCAAAIHLHSFWLLCGATLVFGVYWAPIFAFATRSLHFFTGPA